MKRGSIKKLRGGRWEKEWREMPSVSKYPPLPELFLGALQIIVHLM